MDALKKLEWLWETLNNESKTKSLLKKHCTQNIVDEYRTEKTSYGGTFDQCIRCGVENMDSKVGVHATDLEAYSVFGDLFKPIILDYHQVPELKHPPSDFGILGDIDPTLLDPNGDMIISTRVRVGRTLEGFGFPPTLTSEQRLEIERLSKDAFESLTGDLAGTYFPVSEMTDDHMQQLIDTHFLFKNKNRFLKSACGFIDFPSGRGIFFNKNRNFLSWVNEGDHLRLISMENGSDLTRVYKRLVKAIVELEKKLKFAWKEGLGFVTFCPSNLGTTLRASVYIRIPKLSANPRFKEICTGLNLQARGVDGEHTESLDGVFDISNKHRLGLTEIEALEEMRNGVKEIMTLEKSM